MSGWLAELLALELLSRAGGGTVLAEHPAALALIGPRAAHRPRGGRGGERLLPLAPGAWAEAQPRLPAAPPGPLVQDLRGAATPDPGADAVLTVPGARALPDGLAPLGPTGFAMTTQGRVGSFRDDLLALVEAFRTGAADPYDHLASRLAEQDLPAELNHCPDGSADLALDPLSLCDCPDRAAAFALAQTGRVGAPCTLDLPAVGWPGRWRLRLSHATAASARIGADLAGEGLAIARTGTEDPRDELFEIAALAPRPVHRLHVEARAARIGWLGVPLPVPFPDALPADDDPLDRYADEAGSARGRA